MDPIEQLEDRDDVEKTEIKRYDDDDGKVTLELWHDVESLQNVVGQLLHGVYSEKGVRELIKEEAIATRKTTFDFQPNDTIEYLKDIHDDRNS